MRAGDGTDDPPAPERDRSEPARRSCTPRWTDGDPSAAEVAHIELLLRLLRKLPLPSTLRTPPSGGS